MHICKNSNNQEEMLMGINTKKNPMTSNNKLLKDIKLVKNYSNENTSIHQGFNKSIMSLVSQR